MRSRLVLLFIAMSLVMVSCSGGTKDRSATGGTLTWGIEDRGVFDPYHNQNVLIYSALAYDSLINLRPDGTFSSGIAEKWNADAVDARFTLRPDVTCSDGKRLTASQVAADLTYLDDPKHGSYLYGTFVPSVHFTATGDDASGVVKIKMDKPFAFLLQTIGRVPIVCATGLHDPKTFSSASDGTGPYVLTQAVSGQNYTFTVRKGYKWGPGGASTSAPGTPGKLVLRVIDNETTKANLLLSGELNMAVIKGDDRRRLQARGLDKVESPTAGTWLWFNQLSGRPGADKRVRQALVHALNLAEIVKVNTGGYGSPANGLVISDPKPCPGNTISGLLPNYDVRAAEALLDEAGWVKGADGIRRKGGEPLSMNLHYWSDGGSFERPTVELIAQRWQTVGVRVKITGDPTTKLSQVMYKTSDYDVFQIGFGLDLPSQMVKYLSGQVPPNGTNVAGIDNPSYNKLAAKAASMAYPAACTFWNQAEQALYRDVDPVPIARASRPIFLRNAKATSIGLEVIPTSIRLFN